MNRREFQTWISGGAAAWALSGHGNAADVKPLRVAVIGHTGRGDYGHGVDVMWRKVPRTELVAVADADTKGLAAERKKLGDLPGFADYRQMLREVKPEIAAIALRHVDQHHAMCLAAIEAGVRGIYIEKPLCASLVEADEIVAACQKRNVQLAVAHRNRYHPVLPVVKELLAGKEIGTLLEMRARGKEDGRGGAQDLWVLGCHLFNLAAYFGDTPTACAATLYQNGKPCTRDDIRPGPEGIGPIAGNAAHARFDLTDGTPLFFDSRQNDGDKQAGFGLQLIGTKGIIDFRIDVEPLAHLRRGNPHDPTGASQPWLPITSAGIDRPEPIAGLGTKIASHEASGTDLVEAIEQNRAPLCDVEAGRTTVEMIQAVFASHALNGARVPLPLTNRQHPFAAK